MEDNFTWLRSRVYCWTNLPSPAFVFNLYIVNIFLGKDLTIGIFNRWFRPLMDFGLVVYLLQDDWYYDGTITIISDTSASYKRLSYLASIQRQPKCHISKILRVKISYILPMIVKFFHSLPEFYPFEDWLMTLYPLESQKSWFCDFF